MATKSTKFTNNVLEVVCTQNIRSHPEVLIWNYLDGEHLTFVHGGYQKAEVLFEDGRNSLTQTTTSVPGLRMLGINTVLFVCAVNANCQITYAKQLGIWSRTTITSSLTSEPDFYELTMKYEFYLAGWRKLLLPLLRNRIPIWNETVWQEDVPLKERRYWTRKNGFRDFAGMNKSEHPQPLTLPLRRPSDSPINTHPLRSSTNRREVISDSADRLTIDN